MSGPWVSHLCQIGDHAGTLTTSGCPRVVPAMEWPDPARKNATYTTPERVCTCPCHNRQPPIGRTTP